MPAARTLDCGVAVRPFPGEADTGDRAVVMPSRAGILIGVADGLGHGAGAAEAVAAVVSVLRESPDAGLSTLVARCHERLKDTRGAAVTLARLNHRELRWLGVGNVEGKVLRRAPAGRVVSSLLLMPGVVGHMLPPLRASTVTLEFGDVLVFATDGIDGAFAEEIDPHGTATEIADRILAEHARPSDDALVLVARYIGSGR